MMYSLFAQASRLPLSSSKNLRDVDRRVHNMKYVQGRQHVSFVLQIIPCYDPFQLLDTFMADSEYTFVLSLTICEPRLDSQSSTIYWPIIHWFCDLDLTEEISVEEAEALFGIKVSFGARGYEYLIPKKQLSTIVELNTMCGFDPALEGADICEYHDLPGMEIFENPVKVIPDREINQITLLKPVDDYKDTTDMTTVTHTRAEKEPATSRAQNRFFVVLIALNVLLLSLVILYSIKV
ncbi:hypothetical protein ARMGADRAFT_669498 [Armillaria gallica]|uniref:Uncharacterized protein n=1 Tax=Armillaria gallica TaxID=47427 RepID=A0A2H3D530_ARMGA|nr:hypothetical protein ARMGADRAFT_669498 [Armillaria gallica]